MFALVATASCVCSPVPSGEIEVWLVMQAAMRSTRRVRVLFNFLADRLGTFVKREGAWKKERSAGGKRSRGNSARRDSSR